MLNIKVGLNEHQVKATVFSTDDGLIVHLLGGEVPHVGAVVISEPRPSLTEDGSISCTTSTLPFIGHKDDLALKPLVEKLTTLTEQRVVGVSGIHVKNATENDISLIQENVTEIISQILAHFSK